MRFNDEEQFSLYQTHRNTQNASNPTRLSQMADVADTHMKPNSSSAARDKDNLFTMQADKAQPQPRSMTTADVK